MLKLQPAMTVPAAKSVPAAKLFPATKVESAPVKSAVVGYWSRLPPDPLYLHASLNSAFFALQNVVRVRESKFCAICEFVMKELESKLEDQTTEVGYVLTVSSLVIAIHKMTLIHLAQADPSTSVCFRRR